MFTIDYTISFGNILEIFALSAAALTFFFAMRTDLSILKNDVKGLQESFLRLSAILTQVAVQDARIGMLEKDIHELRHGKGYIE